MYDVAFLRQGEVFLQPVSVFAQRKRIVPDKGFYLTDIISEKTPFEETALVGGGKYDAKMRHQKNPFCEKSILKKFLDRLPAFIARIYTLVIVTVGWSIFSWPDMIDGGRYLKTMFGLDGAGIGNSHTAFMLLNYRFVLLMGIIGSTSLAKRLSNRILPDGTLRREILAALFVFLILGICMAYLINSSYNPFLYFRF